MPITLNNLKPFTGKVFVETGSYRGDGIQNAIDAGFETIYSIELSDKYYDHCLRRFKDNHSVKLFLGDSSKILFDVIKDIDGQITFWLDGHYSCGDTALGEKVCPLVEEFDAIKRHHIKNHIILVDDLRCWSKDREGFDTEDIKGMILEINSKYKFTLVDGLIPGDILAAQI